MSKKKGNFHKRKECYHWWYCTYSSEILLFGFAKHNNFVIALGPLRCDKVTMGG